MHLVVIHDDCTDEGNYLKHSIADPALTHLLDGQIAGKTLVAPKSWNLSSVSVETLCYSDDNILLFDEPNVKADGSWHVISNGRYIASTEFDYKGRILDRTSVDIVVIDVNPSLGAYREKAKLTPDGDVVGFKRWYNDGVQASSMPENWPMSVYVNAKAFSKLLGDDHKLSLNFKEFIKGCTRRNLKLAAFTIGGTVLDLQNESNFLCLVDSAANVKSEKVGSNTTVDKSARISGKVRIGKNVTIGPDAVIVGPCLIGDNVKVNQGAVLKNSLIASGAVIETNQYITDSFYLNGESSKKTISAVTPHQRHVLYDGIKHDKHIYKSWKVFSYVKTFKRVFDVAFSLLVLTLFLPFLPLIALAIKFNSPGPIFYQAKRQGRYGKEIKCLKFRTMMINADKMQEKLRIVNQVDGPQFKIENDPRVTVVGRFLRETCIDEIPQFVNVLLGQMSIVGPRPSPEKENATCPYWRDARLSVKPGITGLWQICRTREPSKDFQEWISYDTKYVKEVSFRLDMWICCKTALKLINDFIDQF